LWAILHWEGRIEETEYRIQSKAKVKGGSQRGKSKIGSENERVGYVGANEYFVDYVGSAALAHNGVVEPGD
jgi:hypothetical protein